jgi:restriction endonuclease S subunit
MYIRGLNPHNIMQGDSLKMYDPARDAGSKTVVIANPPFGAERDQPAYPNVWEEYSKEAETTILFVKLMFDYLKKGGRCAVVVSEGFLTWGQGSACALRKMLLSETNLRAIISLPQGVFVSKSGQGAKTSILYFEKGEPTDFVWYYKIENDGFSMGTNRKPIEGNQIPELLTLFEEVKQGQKPEETSHSFCIDRIQIETLDPQIKERIANETREKTITRNALKREKKVAELDKKLIRRGDPCGRPNTKMPDWYIEEISQFDSNLEAQVENEIAKAIEKAHTYHFNLQNYRASDDDKQMEFPLVELKELITANNNRIKPANLPETEFTILGVSKQIGIFVNEKIKGENIKQSYFKVEKNEFCYNPYRINVGSIGLCELGIESQIISGAYNIFSCDERKLNPKFLDALVKTKKFLDFVNEKATGGVRMDFKIEFMQGWKIPLPPLEIQNEIVEKVEKQKQIIEGADTIIKNYELEIKNEKEDIETIRIDDFVKKGEIKISSGEFLPQKNQQGGEIPVYGGNGVQGYHNESNFRGEVISIGRVGAKCGCVHYINEDCWITDNSFVLQINTKKLLPKYLTFVLQKEDLNQLATITAQPSINQSKIKNIVIPIFSPEIQHQIVEKLDRQMAALESIRFLKAEAERRIEEILAGMWKEKVLDAIPVVIQYENVVEEKAFLKRKILATYIINQSLNDSNFGDVKFQKLLYLSEYFALKRNFGQKYFVQAAGPYDNIFTLEYFKQIEQSKWFNRQRENNQFIFTAGEKHDKSLNTYDTFSDNEFDRINKLISYFKNSTYEKPEIITTLYAVWNNRIIRQKPITDELLKEDFLNWDEGKIKYKDRLDNALAWMRENEIVPDGWGVVIEKAEKKGTKKQKLK